MSGRDPKGSTRRSFLVRGGAVGVAVGLGGALAIDRLRPESTPWDDGRYADPGHSAVAVVRAASYDDHLEATVLDGLRSVGADVRGKTVLIKPNLVEYDPTSIINTDPRLVGAAIVALRRLGAAAITVGEGPGHRRDTDYIVTGSGLWDVLRDLDVPFVDLNVAPVERRALSTSYTSLGELWLPTPVVDADVVLSMPKMKAHHWVGVTLSMKNCFGCVPGRIYGWPKNVLHWQGVPQSVIDVAAAVAPGLVIVDGIVGMEGDGPIMGTPIDAGHLVFGTDPVATDATTARLMGIDPERVDYLREAGRFLGQVHLEDIDQRGEDPEADEVPFELVEEFDGLRVGSAATVGARDASDG